MIVLDTNAWMRWVADPKLLSAKARRAIAGEEAENGLIVSAISVWEISVKQILGKLTLDRDLSAWIAIAATYPGVQIAPLELADALDSCLLPGSFHRDPADRFIVALARRLAAPIVTSDQKIRRYPHVDTIW